MTGLWIAVGVLIGLAAGAVWGVICYRHGVTDGFDEKRADGYWRILRDREWDKRAPFPVYMAPGREEIPAEDEPVTTGEPKLTDTGEIRLKGEKIRAALGVSES